MPQLIYGYGTSPIKGLKFSEPVQNPEYKYDFTDWVVNENQPSDGIVITEKSISITKFKPNLWLIKSDYTGMSDSTAFSNMFYNQQLILSGLDEARAASKISPYIFHPYGDTNTTYHAYGLMITPINPQQSPGNWAPYPAPANTPFCEDYPWDMNIPNGYFKNAAGYYNSWNVFGYAKNETRVMYNWDVYNSIWNQVAFVIYTAADTDADGCITLTTPIKITCVDISPTNYVDPTTIESFNLVLGTTPLYSKPKTFRNTFIDYGIANISNYHSDYRMTYYLTSGATLYPELTSTTAAFNCDGGNWPNVYDRLRYPCPTDLEQLITDRFPVKFSFTQTDINNNGFWHSIKDIFSRVDITDSKAGVYMFAKSNVPEMSLTFNPQVKVGGDGTSIASTNACVLDSCFSACTSLHTVVLTKKGDSNTFNTLSNVFNSCGALTGLTITSVGSNGQPNNQKWLVGQMSGTFEFCGNLRTWPTGITISNTQSQDDGSYAAEINFAFEGAGFTSIGTGEEFNVGLAQQAFNGCSATTVDCTLNMYLLFPAVQQHTYLLFNNSLIQNIRLKNLNHGDWNFDGVTSGRTGQYIGNCSGFSQSTVEYLFNNLYDLSSNSLEVNILKRQSDIPGFQNWTSGGTGVDKRYVYAGFSNSGGYMTISGVNGKFFKFNVSNMQSGEQLTVTDGVTTRRITGNGQYYIDVTGTYCSVTANTVNSGNKIGVNYDMTWDKAVDSITSAAIYCPSEWDDTANSRYITASMVGEANTKGWTVYVGGVERPMAYYPLTFEITSPGNIVWKAQHSAYTCTIEYKKNDGAWTSITSSTGGTNISVVSGDTVQFRGNNATYSSNSSNYNCFSGTTCQFKVKGNIMSLINSTNFATTTILQSANTFLGLFSYCTGLTDAGDLLLPATTLAQYCYSSTFYGCTSLTTAPELPATTLVDWCYYGMFFNCTNLNYIKCLATNTSATNCTNYWVYGVQTNSGTFVKNPSMSSWGTGVNGIPKNWTVQDAS